MQFSEPDKKHVKWILFLDFIFSCVYFRFAYAVLSCSHESHHSSYSKSHSRLTPILLSCRDKYFVFIITHTAFVVSLWLVFAICPNYFATESAIYASGPKSSCALASRFVNCHLALDLIPDN